MGGLRVVSATLALASTAACGRIGFEPATRAEDAAPGDGTSAAFVTSITRLTTAAGFSWVDLAVDWTRELAYLGTRETGECFAVVDFAATPPVVVARVRPPASNGTRCLGVELHAGGTQLLVASEAAGTVELFDLGADPRAGSYTLLANVDVNAPRRISRAVTDPTRFYVAGGSSNFGAETIVVNGQAPWLVVGTPYDSATACANSGNDLTVLASGAVVVGCANNDSPVELAGGVGMTLLGTIGASPPAGSSGFWSATRTPDGGVAAMLGWVTVIVQSGGTAGGTLAARVDNDDCYRGATIADRGTGPELWTARGDGFVDVISLADPTDPVVIGRGPLGAVGDPYAIELEPGTTRGIVITNGGDFVLFDAGAIPAITERWPTF